MPLQLTLKKNNIIGTVSIPFSKTKYSSTFCPPSPGSPSPAPPPRWFWARMGTEKKPNQTLLGAVWLCDANPASAAPSPRYFGLRHVVNVHTIYHYLFPFGNCSISTNSRCLLEGSPPPLRRPQQPVRRVRAACCCCALVGRPSIPGTSAQAREVMVLARGVYLLSGNLADTSSRLRAQPGTSRPPSGITAIVCFGHWNNYTHIGHP